MSLDKRKNNRLPVIVPVKAKGSASTFFEMQACDLSHAGLGIYSNTPLQQDQEVRLKIHLPGEMQALDAHTKVMWTKRLREPESFEMQGGLWIKGIPSLERTKLVNFIHQHLGSWQKPSIFTESADGVDQLKEGMRGYLQELKKEWVILEEGVGSGKIDFLAQDRQGRPVLIFVFAHADNETLLNIMAGMDWFVSSQKLVARYHTSIKVSSRPRVCVFSFSFAPAFLRNISYIKGLPLEILEVKFLTSKSACALFVRKQTLLDCTAVGEETVVQASPEPRVFEEVYELGDHQRKIIKWLSKKDQ